MTSAQVVETSITNYSSFQNYTHPDDHTIRTKKTTSNEPCILPNLLNMQSFIRLRCKTVMKIWNLKLVNFYKDGRFRIPYFHEFATDSCETSHIYLTGHDKKSGHAHVFWLNEKILKSITSSYQNSLESSCVHACQIPKIALNRHVSRPKNSLEWSRVHAFASRLNFQEQCD